MKNILTYKKLRKQIKVAKAQELNSKMFISCFTKESLNLCENIDKEIKLLNSKVAKANKKLEKLLKSINENF